MIAIDYFRSKEFEIPADYRYYRHLKGKTKYKVKRYGKGRNHHTKGTGKGVTNSEWNMIEAIGTKRGNRHKGFHTVCLMEETEFKAFVKRLLSTGINAGIEYAKKRL